MEPLIAHGSNIDDVIAFSVPIVLYLLWRGYRRLSGKDRVPADPADPDEPDA